MLCSLGTPASESSRIRMEELPCCGIFPLQKWYGPTPHTYCIAEIPREPDFLRSAANSSVPPIQRSGQHLDVWPVIYGCIPGSRSFRTRPLILKPRPYRPCKKISLAYDNGTRPMQEPS